MELQTSIVYSEEKDKVTRIEVHCPLHSRLPQQLREHVIPRFEFYANGIAVVATQNKSGFTLTTRGDLPLRIDTDRINKLVGAMREKALELYAELSRLLKLHRDVDTLTVLGLEPALVSGLVKEVGELKARMSIVEILLKEEGEEDRDIVMPLEYGPLRGYAEYQCNRGTSFDESCGSEPPLAEPDYLGGEPMTADGLVLQVAHIINVIGIYVLGGTLLGLAGIAALKFLGVI